MIRKTTKTALILIFVALPVTAQNANPGKVGDCLISFSEKINRPAHDGSEIKSLDQLPRKIFVAQSADYLVETKDEMKLWGRQSFVSGESKAICASLPKNAGLGISMYAPALIDLSDDHKTGNSFWQFHLMVSEGKIGLWNQHSRLHAKAENFLPRLQEAGIQTFLQAMTPTNYQIHFIRKSERGTEHLIIRYDLVDSLQ